MTFVMALGMLTGLPLSNAAKESDSKAVLQVLSDLSLNAEPITVSAAVSSNFRRPINNESPVWIVHIDSWNYPDPEKIIDLVPEDVLPYVVFNISLSINWSTTEHRWLMVQDGVECARSWMKACADKGVWTMIQPSSGGQSHFPDYSADYDLDNTIFGEFFRDYPNFIGYNYCEQFWGFASQDFPVTYQQRYNHFAALLKLCNKYGGYLDVSWCENQWASALNPVAMLKTNSNWEKACRTYAQNFILEEKYTQSSYISDVESEVYGAYISGYCGNYGVRWDDTGWSDYPWSGKATKNQYRLSTSLPIYLERMAMNGMTVIDGPELVWADCVKSLWDGTDSEGYKYRQWDFYDQCKNVNVDIMRKFIDGSLRIPDRKEVIDRTKVVVIQDVNSGSNDDKYCSYKTLFEGLYRADNDGNFKDNHNPYKSTGRYQTIPTVYGLLDDLAKSIPVQIKQSTISSRWSSISAKKAEFNKLYPDSYYANCYVANNENTWMTYYNSKVSSGDKGAKFTLKYNTCKSFDIKHQLYGSALINEYSDHIDVYMNNYDEDAKTTLKTESITISGASAKPTFTAKDRGTNQTKSSITEKWNNGTYTLTVKHNGPVDISIKCSGHETGRKTSYTKAKQTAPAFPGYYTGARQYEGENFDMKNVEGNVTNGCSDKNGPKKYYGMGFVKFGKKNTAAVKDTVKATKAGTFKWTLRYSATSDVKCVDLYVNGSKVKTLSLPRGSGYDDWKTISENINLKVGENKIELKANATLPCSLYIDNFKVEASASGNNSNTGNANAGNNANTGNNSNTGNNTNTGNNSNTSNNNTATSGVTKSTNKVLQDGWYYIKGVKSQKYLEADDSSVIRNNTNVQIGDGDGATGQRWYLKNEPDGVFTLKNGSGYMLDIDYGRADNLTNVQLYTANQATAQKYMIGKTSTDGQYAILTVCSDARSCIDVAGAKNASGTNVCEYVCKGSTNQLWIFEPCNAPVDNSGSNNGTDIPSDSGNNNSSGASAGTYDVQLVDGKIDLSAYAGKTITALTFDVSANSTGNGAVHVYTSNGGWLGSTDYSYTNANTVTVDLSHYSNIRYLKFYSWWNSNNASFSNFKVTVK